ncbi:hypothetical protein GCM10011403_28420 [Pseudohongiella nitratireducens]|jgi:predicted kinase|uniref:Uncharacterized protein n=2 Tax=Pseudohongiella nitratireducens TaxID=1768907 RepID=A0A916VJW9_9GAMM|nr:AAA family ATPase [Pseudohongiella nitratireducens]GFZ83214.1 hypothetical protein GCM10011403_28420 [Pseudohongiella nitratireducens]
MSPVIVVSGSPASGKTTVAQWLASKINIPLLSKDDYKERLFDKFGIDDRAWSKRLGKISFNQLCRDVRCHVARGNSFILESAFRSDDGEALSEMLISRPVIHAHCVIPPSLALTRFRIRARTQGRHKGHADETNLKELSLILEEEKFEPSIINSQLILVPSDDYSHDYLEARKKVYELFYNIARLNDD